MSYFAPKNFPALINSSKTVEELIENISAFCTNYDLDSLDCANELMSFASTFNKFDQFSSCDRHASEESDEENNESESEDEEVQSGGERLKEIRVTLSYHRALKILANPSFHLVDAYPTLYVAYGKILAIPMTSCTPERSFSVVKRVKTRLRSTMEQERLESLVLMAIEKNIVEKLDRDKIIDTLGCTSIELSKLLIK